jgi:hypothetical protein
VTARAHAVEPSAPDTLHIDIAAALAQAASAAPLGPMPHPETAMELHLLQSARECGAGLAQLPRRELVAVALREAERQQWWRDQAEAEVVRLQREVAQLRDQRHKLLALHFELVAWASHQIGCLSSSEAVLAKIREKGSGLMRHELDGRAADEMRGQDPA